MGTSKSYTASIQGQPQWGELSGGVTRSCNGAIVSNNNLVTILSNYVSVIGGAKRAGRGNSRIAGLKSLSLRPLLSMRFASPEGFLPLLIMRSFFSLNLYTVVASSGGISTIGASSAGFNFAGSDDGELRLNCSPR